jgi:hypothetical protein
VSRAVLVGAAAAMVMAPTGTAHTTTLRNDFRIVLDERIGPYRYLDALDHGRSYPAAVAAFGRVSARGLEANLCVVRWRSIGLEVDFAAATRPCSRAELARSAWYGATAYTRRWSTARGLRVGDGERRLRALYPHARFRDRPPEAPTWSLVRRRVDEFNFELLSATVWNGKVRSITLGPGYVY